MSIVGKGKFEGIAVCDASKNSATVSSDCSTDAKYFSYEDTAIIHSAEIVDIDKCKAFMQNPVGLTEAQANTFCTTGSLTINNKTLTVNDLALEVSTLEGYSYETIGLKVDAAEGISITGYNIEGGTDVVIPSQIDGKTVVAIAELAFTGHGVIPKPTAYNNDYKVSLLSYNSNNNYVVKPFFVATYAGLGITSVIIPNTITSIGARAFINNEIISITFPDTPVTLGCGVFSGNPIMEDGNYSFPSNVTVNCNMGSQV